MADHSPQIVAIGEVLWDEFPDGVRLGGAPANFAVHCAALGGKTALVSRVGVDARGEETLRRLAARGVAIEGVQRDEERPTGRVVVTLQHGKPFYEIVEGVAWDAIAWEEPLAVLAKRTDVVCFGTLAQRHPKGRRSLIRFVRETRDTCLKVLDINFRQHYHSGEVVRESLLLADLLKLSDEETPILRGYLGGASDDGAFLADVRKRFGIETVVQTLGAEGCRVIGPEGDIRVPSEPQRVVNTVGAGDAFSAAYVLCRIAGRDALTCARHANRVGGYVTTQDSGTPELPSALRIATTQALECRKQRGSQMAEKPDYDGMREKAGFRWSVSAAYYAYYALTGIPIEDVNTKPEAMIELIRQGRPKFREIWGDEIPLPGISTPAISYGHLNTLGADLVFPKGGEVNYTRICDSLGEGIKLLKKPVDFLTAGMVPFYLDFRERLRKAFPGENVGFGFSVQGPMTTAYCLRDLGIFTDVFDDLNGTKEFLSLITESVLDYKRFLADLNGQSHVSPTGYKLYDDVGSMFSASMWPELVLPYYERVFQASTTGRRGAHIEDLRPEHLPLLEDMGLVDFDPGISHKINPKILSQRCRVPFGWRMGSFHYTGLTMQEVEEWVYQAAADGASYVFTSVEATMVEGGTPAKVKTFMRAARKVDQMMKEGASRADVGKMVSDAGRKRFWDRWPQ